jgi:hypothetical protein
MAGSASTAAIAMVALSERGSERVMKVTIGRENAKFRRKAMR